MTSLRSLFLSLPYFFTRRISKELLDKTLSRYHRPYIDQLQERPLLYVAASCLPYHISGYTSRTHEVLKAIKNHGHSVNIITRPGYPWDRKDSLILPKKFNSRRDELVYEHIKRPSGRKPALNYILSAAKVIEKYIIKNKIGCVHAASNYVNALPALLAARKLGLPFQYEMRGLWELSRASRIPEYNNSPGFHFGLEMEAYVASHADRLFVISRQLGLYAMRNWRINQDKIRLLPNCVDIERIKPFSDIKTVPGLIGYAGSLIAYEGLDILLEALAILNSKNMRIKLMIIGDGEGRPALEKLACKLGLADQVTFVGRLDPESARARLAEASMVCIPRKNYEVCKIITPLKLVEAMALGKAVICPDLPVFLDELGDLANGWTFKANDAASLAERIENKFGDEEAISRQGHLLRQKVINTRQWKQYIPDIRE